METSTFDLMTDQECLDALVSHSLTEFIDDRRIKTLRPYAFYRQSQLQKIVLPVTNTISANDVFYHCTNLNCLYLGADKVLSPSIDLSAIANGEGIIYVPDNQLTNYKSSVDWMPYDYAIFPISDYPRTINATINKTWEEIIADCNNGNYKNQFTIGDTAIIELGTYRYLARIIAIDQDILSNDSEQTAHVTWLLTHSFHIKHNMNDTNTNEGGWATSNARAWLNDIILTQYFPSILQNNILSVQKSYYDTTTNSTLISNDKLWIPSLREIGGYGRASSYSETQGVVYTYFQDIDEQRIRRVKNDNSYNFYSWWLRTADKDNASTFVVINSQGNTTTSDTANSTRGILIGFCT